MGRESEIGSIRLIVGLEIHVELATRSKMFTRAGSPAHAAAGEPEPNSLIDAVVLGLPGALPVMNREAVELAMLVGLALGCEIAAVSMWDRKSYFYPDLPKGYQISQYDRPLCVGGRVEYAPADEGGRVDLDAPAKTARIVRAHLEEDAGKLLHEAPGGGAIDGSNVDWNRAGTPLLEIVTEPDFESADDAVSFARQLREVCRFLGATEGVMQAGHMRFEPNINCELKLADGGTVFTPIVEVKNLNSFRALHGAIEYEARAQPKRWLGDGIEHGPGTKSTRGWDDAGQKTLLQREKEDAHDYRYFPDPDLVPVEVDEAWLDRVRSRLVEPPLDRRRRYVRDYGIGTVQAGRLIEEREDCGFFEAAVRAAEVAGADSPAAGNAVANLVLQAGARLANERGVLVSTLGVTPGQAGVIAAMRAGGEIGSDAADTLFERLCEPDGAGFDARGLAGREGLLIVRDEGQLDAWCDEVIASNAAIADDVRAGKTQAVGRLIGAVMQLSGGSADAKAVRERLLQKLG